MASRPVFAKSFHAMALPALVAHREALIAERDELKRRGECSQCTDRQYAGRIRAVDKAIAKAQGS